MIRSLLRAAFLAAVVAVPPIVVVAPVVAEEAGAVRRATVVDYAGDADLAARAAAGKTVVFFFANWCPNCRATVTELNARWGEVAPDLTLVIADYDKETDLKRRFGITYQDTFVLVDKTGAAVKAWNGGGVDGLNRNTRT